MFFFAHGIFEGVTWYNVMLSYKINLHFLPQERHVFSGLVNGPAVLLYIITAITNASTFP